MDTALWYLFTTSLLTHFRLVQGGEWGPWEATSECSATCGYGTHTRTRQWIPSASDRSGASGRNETQEHAICVREDCPEELCQKSRSQCGAESNRHVTEIKNMIRNDSVNKTLVSKACRAFQRTVADCEEYFTTNCSGIPEMTSALDTFSSRYGSVCGPEVQCERDVHMCQLNKSSVDLIEKARSDPTMNADYISQACLTLDNSTEHCLNGLAQDCLQFLRVNDTSREIRNLLNSVCSKEIICQGRIRRCQEIKRDISIRLPTRALSPLDLLERAKLCQYYGMIWRCYGEDVDDGCSVHPSVVHTMNVTHQAELRACSLTTGIFLRCPPVAECLQTNFTQCGSQADMLDCIHENGRACELQQNETRSRQLREETRNACKDVAPYEAVLHNCTAYGSCLQGHPLLDTSTVDAARQTTPPASRNHSDFLCHYVESTVGCLAQAAQACIPQESAVVARLKARHKMIEDECLGNRDFDAITGNPGNRLKCKLHGLAVAVLFCVAALNYFSR